MSTNNVDAIIALATLIDPTASPLILLAQALARTWAKGAQDREDADAWLARGLEMLRANIEAERILEVAAAARSKR
jgi:hypothetical protein